MINADTFLTYVKNNPSLGAFTLRDGAEEQKSGHTVRTKVGFQNVNSLELIHRIGSRYDTKAEITADEVRNFFDFFGPAYKYAPTMYRNVKPSAHWRTAYNVVAQGFNKISRAGVASVGMEDGTSCRRCEDRLSFANPDDRPSETAGRRRQISRVPGFSRAGAD